MIGEYIYICYEDEKNEADHRRYAGSVSLWRQTKHSARCAHTAAGKTKTTRHNRAHLHKEQQTQTRYGGWTENNLLASQSNMQFSHNLPLKK